MKAWIFVEAWSKSFLFFLMKTKYFTIHCTSVSRRMHTIHIDKYIIQVGLGKVQNFDAYHLAYRTVVKRSTNVFPQTLLYHDEGNKTTERLRLKRRTLLFQKVYVHDYGTRSERPGTVSRTLPIVPHRSQSDTTWRPGF